MDHQLTTTVVSWNLSGTINRRCLSVSQCTRPVRSRLDHSPTIAARHYVTCVAGHVLNSNRFNER